MAVYTPLGPEDLAGLLRTFGAGELQHFAPVAEGIENTNYRVTAAGGDFILTVYERTSTEQVAAVLRVTETLAGRGVPCPRPLCTGEGERVGRYRGRPVSLVEFVPGGSPGTPEEPQLESMGRSLARLHRYGSDLFLPERAHCPEVLLPAGLQLSARLADERPALAALLREECRWQEALLPDPNLPGGLIHTDLFRDNVLFANDGDRVAALLDFHLAGRGAWLFDLAVVLLDWCWVPHGLDTDRARGLLRGYRQVRPVEGAEYRHLPAMLRRAALRYLCLRCERFLLPDRERVLGVRKDPAEFAAKLETLRSARAVVAP